MPTTFGSLEEAFELHTELLDSRKGQSLEELGEIDSRIIRLEEYIYKQLELHPEFQAEYQNLISEFFI